MADGLAKQAAAVGQPPLAVTRLLDSAVPAALHACRLLGKVTHAANHYPVHEIGPDGVAISRTLRDSADRPQRLAAKKVLGQVKCDARELKAVPAKPPAPAAKVAPWLFFESRGSSTAGTKAVHRRIAAKAEAECLQRRINSIGSALRPSHDTPSAADRISALRRRVLGEL